MAAGRSRFIFSGSLILALLLLGSGIDLRAEAKNDFKVAATISPLADIAKHIASSEVISILRAGANPHTFELSPQMIKGLEGVRIIFVIGHGFDDWIEAIGESLPDAQTITVDEGIDFLEQGGKDPHYWLSIANAKIIAQNMARALSEFNPERKSSYEENLNRYLGTLDEADERIRIVLSDLTSRKIITFHDGWRYFARDYGLEVIGNIEPSQGGEPTPKHLFHLGKVIQSENIEVLFSEPAVSKALAESLAKDFHLRLYELDPIGGRSRYMSFIDLMTANAETIREALSHG